MPKPDSPATLCFLPSFSRPAQWRGFCPFYDPHSRMFSLTGVAGRCRALTPHTMLPFVLKRTKLYGYKLHAPAPLPRNKAPLCVLSRRHGCLAEEINPLLLPRKEAQFVGGDESYEETRHGRMKNIRMNN